MGNGAKSCVQSVQPVSQRPCESTSPITQRSTGCIVSHAQQLAKLARSQVHSTLHCVKPTGVFPLFGCRQAHLRNDATRLFVRARCQVPFHSKNYTLLHSRAQVFDRRARTIKVNGGGSAFLGDNSNLRTSCRITIARLAFAMFAHHSRPRGAGQTCPELPWTLGRTCPRAAKHSCLWMNEVQ